MVKARVTTQTIFSLTTIINLITAAISRSRRADDRNIFSGGLKRRNFGRDLLVS